MCSTGSVGASEKDPFELDTAQECDLVNENGWNECQEAKKVETGRWTAGLIESEAAWDEDSERGGLGPVGR